MVKPRTAPHGGKPHTAPEFQHSILSQAEQAKLLGRSDETTRNLGHPSSEDRLMEHPLDKVQDYQNHASEKIVRGPPRSQGVYRRFKNPQSGIANEANLGKWASYAHSNSYAVVTAQASNRPCPTRVAVTVTKATAISRLCPARQLKVGRIFAPGLRAAKAVWKSYTSVE